MTETRWVTLFEATPREVVVVRGLLEDAGIASFVPDEVTKIVDPFITGANPFQERLQVAEDDVERARGVLEKGRHALADAVVRAGGAEGATSGAAEADDKAPQIEDFEPDEEDRAPDPVEDRAFLTILFAVLIVTLPLSILAGLGYFAACRRAKRRSVYHRWVWVAFAAPFLLGLAALAFWLWPPPRPGGVPFEIQRPPPRTSPIGPLPR